MTPDEFARLRRLFEEALQHPPEARRAFLDAAAAGRPEVRAAVEQMLAADAQTHALVDHPGPTRPASVAAPQPARCPSCGTALTARPRFCPECGSPVAGDGAEGRFRAGALFANRFRIVAALGHGGMGEVYRAQDLELGQPVALKFLTALHRDARARTRLRSEVRLARQIAHPNVCRVYDIGEAHGELYLSMEYVDGEDLAALLKRIGRLPVDKGIEIARKLCAGLAAAHAKGVLHRDFKPANIMIDSHGEVRIMDFGLAAIASELEAHDVRSGTPAYMAPEQLAGREATVQSDLYALGLVLYELFTGKVPFAARTPDELQRQRGSHPSTTPATLIPELGPHVERAILRCLEPAPKLRPTSALEVSASLPGGDPLAEALAAGETPSPEMVAAARHRVGLHPAAAIAIVTFIAAGCAAAVLMRPQIVPFQRLASGRSPDVLMERASEIIRRAGFLAMPADREYAIGYNNDLLQYLRQQDPRGGHGRGLRARDAALFRFRQSGYPLERITLAHAFQPLFPARPERPDPPMLWPGEVRVVMTMDGDLREFEGIPSTNVESPLGAEPDWMWLLARTGLDVSTFVPSEPERLPSRHADVRKAWRGTHPDAPGAIVRIEAAAYRGQLVWLEVVTPWTPSREGPRLLLPSRLGVPAAVVVMLLVCGAFILARRNTRLGRGDLGGATRLAMLVFAVFILHWMFTAHHVPTIWEVMLFLMSACAGTATAAALWVMYVALEPETRRRWPDVLVSWTRVLSGQWRDDLVHRDVLIGTATGVYAVLVFPYLGILAAGWLGIPPYPQPVVLETFVPSFASGVALLVVNGIAVSLMFFFLWFVLRVTMKRVALACAAWVLIFGGVEMFRGSWLDASMIALQLAVIFLVLTRIGWLAYLVGRFVAIALLFAPVALGRSVWFADTGFAVLGLIALLTAYGAWPALTAYRHEAAAAA